MIASTSKSTRKSAAQYPIRDRCVYLRIEEREITVPESVSHKESFRLHRWIKLSDYGVQLRAKVEPAPAAAAPAGDVKA